MEKMNTHFTLYSGGEKTDGQWPVYPLLEPPVGIFETMRVYQGKIFRKEEHLRRFYESCKSSGFTNPPSGKLLEKELNQSFAAHLKENSDARKAACLLIRLAVYGKRLVIMIGNRNYPASFFQNGIRLKTANVLKSAVNAWPAEVKTAAYQNMVMAGLSGGCPETEDRLILDRNGYVTEVRTGNIFIVKDGRLRTPPADGILNGVTRMFVIECARIERISVEETLLTRHDIFNADEAFLTNTSWEILPVRELDGRRTGRTLPGPVTLQLERTFKRRVQAECRP